MCGFAGYVNLDGAPAERGLLAAMLRAIRHRGPDDCGQVHLSLGRGVVTTETDSAADAAIGFQRLKVLDLSDQGHQPMANAAGTIVIAFNGEVYNAFDFKPALEAAGCRFRSRTDTEILLHLYERYGLSGLLERVNGMFALVIADLRAREIHIARDHFGIKPLYWTQAGSTVLFASEAKAFLAHRAFDAAIDDDYIDEQLAFRYLAGDATLLKGVKQLRPGHRLTIAPAGMSATQYWSIPDVVNKVDIGLDAAVDRLDSVLRASVTSQLRSDVTVGCQLSGGIDSSLVSLFARPQPGGLDTFSVVFDDPKFSEERWIDEAAAIAGVRSHCIPFTADAFIGSLEQATWHMDQPISHPNSLGLWHLARYARDHVTVLLSGEGADELFGGYSRFADGRTKPVEACIQATQFQPASKLARLRPGANVTRALERREAIFREGHSDDLSKRLKYDMQTHMVDLLVRQDKMTMAHGVENRVPFLDRRVVDFARALPSGLLVGSVTKVILKALARRTFSCAFVDRPKGAFNLPLSQYFRGRDFTQLMEDQLLPGMTRRGVVDATAVRELWRRSLSAPALTEVFWIPVALELWAQQFVDRRGYASA